MGRMIHHDKKTESFFPLGRFTSPSFRLRHSRQPSIPSLSQLSGLKHGNGRLLYYGAPMKPFRNNEKRKQAIPRPLPFYFSGNMREGPGEISNEAGDAG